MSRQSLRRSYLICYIIGTLCTIFAVALLGWVAICIALEKEPLASVAFLPDMPVFAIFIVIIAIAGVVLVSGFFENTDMGALSLFGVAMGVLCGIMYAVCGVATRILGDRGMDPFVMNFYFFLFGSISVLPLCHWDQVATFVSAAPLQGIGWLVSQSLVCAILPYVLFTIAISHMDLGIASTLELVEPAWAMFMGFLLYGENPTVLMVIGVIVVIIAVAMSFRNPKAVRETPSDPPADPAGA